MSTITFDSVTKSYGSVTVIEPFSVEIEEGEFLVLLGPSGCGKSTMLRIIAGLTEPSSGHIEFAGEDITDWDVRRRDVAFVFQSYALYPQMSVFENIAFPMLMDRFKAWHHVPFVGFAARRRMLRSDTVRQRVEAVAEQLNLGELLHRRPRALSGGQRQRVALARALVREPRVFLFDEPLSNLDAKLRAQMRSDLTRLHRDVERTFIYVTHDQIEAMTMATRIIVMADGRIQQVGTPDEIYDRPRNLFVATFVGAPAMNVLPAHHLRAALGSAVEDRAIAEHVVGIRPEHVALGSDDHPLGLPAVVETVERLGADAMISCRLLITAGDRDDAPVITVRLDAHERVMAGEQVSVVLDLDKASWFDSATGERVEQSCLIAR